MKDFAYRNLLAYQKGKELILLIYKLLKLFPKTEQYALCDQLRRAAVSVTSNIAEGMTRQSEKEKCHFLEISYGSLMEVSSQMDVACDLGYITKEQLNSIDDIADETAKLLSGLQNKFKSEP